MRSPMDAPVSDASVTGIAGGAGEVHAAEVVPPDGLVEPVLKLLLDELVWQVHVNPFWLRS